MKILMVFIAAFLSVVIVGGAYNSSFAGQCGYNKCWGAVGIGSNGAWGYAYGQRSQGAAQQVAQNGCRGNCNIIKTFYNSCGAIAVADNGGWGWGYESNLELAESTAMNYCMDNGYNCQVVTSTCSY